MKVLFTILFAVFSFTTFAQVDTARPIYKRFPTLPPIKLLMTDSATTYTKENIPKKKPVLIMFFSPDCEHCQHEAVQLVDHKDDFSNTHIIMVSTYPFYRIKEFRENYGLEKMNSLVMAKDPEYFLLTFYGIHSFPYMAYYDKKGDLVNTFEGSRGVEKVLALMKKTK